MYADGVAGKPDYVSAYAWLDLASASAEGAAGLRDRIAKKMSTEQIAQARGLAAELRRGITKKEAKEGNEKP
jgi:hypothetical protein